MSTKKEALMNKKLYGDCQKLENWSEIKAHKLQEIDAILEWLDFSGYLNAKGQKFTMQFWAYAWHKNPKDITMSQNRLAQIKKMSN